MHQLPKATTPLMKALRRLADMPAFNRATNQFSRDSRVKSASRCH